MPLFAKGVLQSLDSARDKSHTTILALQGDLGAGKTTFTQALARELGISETIQSPTYVLMKKYEVTQGETLYNKVSPWKTLVHIDAYRLNNAEEFAALKPEQFLNDPKVLVVVEWPEKVEGALPKAALTLNFSSQDAEGGERYIEVV